MIHGINNKSELNEVLKYANSKTLPLNLNKSISNYEKNAFMKEVLGEEIHYHFSAFYNFEFSEYMNQVDNWELNRYFLQI